MKDHSKIRSQIEARLSELKDKLEEIYAPLAEPLNPDIEDQAIEHEDDEVNARLGLSAQQETRLLKQALKRIDDGIYGFCEECGEEILPSRLEAVPYASLCRTCANAGPQNS